MNKGQKAGNSPIEFEVVKGKSYYWCSCGKGKKQPFCDGSHKGSGYTPNLVEIAEDKKIAFCACQQTSNGAYCDGSHKTL